MQIIGNSVLGGRRSTGVACAIVVQAGIKVM